VAFSAVTLEAFEFNKVALLWVVALVTGGLSLAGALSGRDSSLPHPIALWAAARGMAREPVTFGALLFTLSAVVSTVWSVSPVTSLRGTHESFAGLGTVAAYFLLFLASRQCCATAADGWRLLSGAAVGVAITAADALLQALRLDPYRWGDVSAVGGYVRPFGTLGHANHLAAYLVIGLPLTGCLALRAARARCAGAAAVLGAVVVVALAAVAATLSRGGWVALAGVAAVLTVMGWSRLNRRRFATALIGVAVAAAGAWAVAEACGLQISSRVAARARQWGDGAGRVDIWQSAWAMFRERPLTGVGLDCFQLGFSRHRSVPFWQKEWNTTPAKAHNEVLHVLATQGLFGATAGLVLTGGLILAARRSARPTAAPDERLLRAAAVAGVAGFYLQNLFSFTVAANGSLFITLAAVLSRLAEGEPATRGTTPAVASVTPGLLGGTVLAAGVFLANGINQGVSAGPPWWIGAMILGGAAAAVVVALVRAGLTGRGFGAGDRPGWRQAAVAATALAVAFPLVGRPYRADLLARAADGLLDGAPAEAVPGYEAAVAADPGRDLLWAKLAQAAWSAAAQQPDAAAQQRLWLRARSAAERAVRLVPAEPTHWVGLGRILTGLAREGLATPTETLAAFDTALSLDPKNTVHLAAAGEAACALSRPGLARDYLKRGLAFDLSQASLYAGLAMAAMQEGHFEEAEQLFTSASVSDWHADSDAFARALALRAACMLHLRQPEMAEAMARQVLSEHPDWMGPRYTLANALARLNRPEAADEYRAVAAQAPDHPFAAEARRWLQAHRR
jgi:O-antigen ligase/tetratricopeptide (TPR) repeat protein